MTERPIVCSVFIKDVTETVPSGWVPCDQAPTVFLDKLEQWRFPGNGDQMVKNLCPDHHAEGTLLHHKTKRSA